MYWLLEDNCFGKRHDEIVEQCERFKFEYGVHILRPFTHELVPEAPNREDIIVLGSLQLGKVAKQRSWKPGAYNNDNFNFEIQRQHWGDAMLNADAQIYKFGDIPEQPKPFFIRPVHDTKSIKGGVFDWFDYSAIKEALVAGTYHDHDLSLDTSVVVALEKKIFREWRLWIVRGKIITYSLYRVGSRLYPWNGDGLGHDVQVFASSILYQRGLDPNVWLPAEAFVMDVAETENGCKIIEINTINHSGLYEAAINELLLSLDHLGRYPSKSI